jgi:hypothetical protein
MRRNRRPREGYMVAESGERRSRIAMQSLSAVTPALVRGWDIPCRPRIAGQKLCMELELIQIVKEEFMASLRVTIMFRGRMQKRMYNCISILSLTTSTPGFQLAYRERCTKKKFECQCSTAKTSISSPTKYHSHFYSFQYPNRNSPKKPLTQRINTQFLTPGPLKLRGRDPQYSLL